MAKKKPKCETLDITVKLKVNGTVYEAQGESIEDAIQMLPTFQPKTTGSLTVVKEGKTSREMMLNINAMKRLFFPGMTGQTMRTMISKRYAFYA